MQIKITVLPGDGIGPEVTSEAVRVLDAVAKAFNHEIEFNSKSIGASAIREFNNPLPEDTLTACLASDAVLLGAVGDPAFDNRPTNHRPEAGLLSLRRELGAFANLRPARLYPALGDSSPLKPDVIKGTDVLIVRELLGGLYFGEPRGIDDSGGKREGVNTMRYAEPEIERIARVAFELARGRRRKVTSVDKANVLECSQFWRETVKRVAADYPDVTLEHQYVDSCAMALVARPASFDVMLAENMFGDILSDEAGAVVGSLGLLASASIGGSVGLYEPVHGSAPDIAGKGIANPLGAILCAAMMLRYSFNLETEAASIERAVEMTLEAGYRTRDLTAGEKYVTTSQMAEHIIARIQRPMT
ncbi:MAG TPA: 3-isopropylmalate dehydrogenase [Blastocatellia bacterium]|nr:3-isopropylmalate dehydrogenase [Blastocatellia bacterium]